MKRITSILLITLFSTAVWAKKSDEQYIADLKSDDDKTVITAANYLGQEEVKDAVDPLITVVKTHKNPRARAAAATSLGLVGEKKTEKVTPVLRYVVENDEEKDVVYAAMIAMLNLGDYENEDTLKALDYADQNHRDDKYIADMVDRIKKKKEEEEK